MFFLGATDAIYADAYIVMRAFVKKKNNEY